MGFYIMVEYLLHLGTVFIVLEPNVPSSRGEDDVLEDGRKKPELIHELVHQRGVPSLNACGDIFWPFYR